MTDKEKAIKDLKEMLDNLDITNKYRLNIIRAIEYLQKESASEDFESEWKRYCDSKGGGAVTMNIKDVAKHFAQWGSAHHKNKATKIASEDLEQASKEWLRPQLDKSYANYGERKMMDLTRFDGYAMLDAIEFGAQWQKEQMMKDAIECHIDYYDGPILDFTQKQLDDALEKSGAKVGDKVKVIIIKE